MVVDPHDAVYGCDVPFKDFPHFLPALGEEYGSRPGVYFRITGGLHGKMKENGFPWVCSNHSKKTL